MTEYYTDIQGRLDAVLARPTSKKTVVISASSNDYAFALFVTLKSLFKHSPKLMEQAELIIYGYQYTQKTKDLLRTCGPMEIVDYDFALDMPDNFSVRTFTPALFSRFEGFRLLDKYERVMCLDCDVLVQKELVGVFDLVKTGIGMVLDDSIFTVRMNLFQPIDGFDMQRTGFNAGFIVLNRLLKMEGPYSQVSDFCYQFMAQYANEIYLGDQAVINIALQQFNFTPTVLSGLWNKPASFSGRALKKAFIIHSTGPRKFWCYYYFREWYDLYAQWHALGGHEAKNRKDSERFIRFCRKHQLTDRVFVQLMPDFFKRPLKALLFCIKYLLKVKY